MEVRAAPSVFVIIVTFNGREYLRECLPTLAATIYPNFTTLLVDNASNDGSAELARRLNPGIEVIQNARNLGFAEGNNGALRVALKRGADYVILLNDDTRVLAPEWIEVAVDLAEKDRRIGMIGYEFVTGGAQAPAREPLIVSPAPHLPGCALFIRGELLRHIGIFDPVYFAYYEEDDLEARALRAGYMLMRINVPIYHLGSGSSRRMRFRAQYLRVRNAIRVSIKNRSTSRTLLRLFRLFDICCNPWPVAMQAENGAHQAIRSGGNLLRNFLVFSLALLWNLVMLPWTIRARQKDNERIRTLGGGAGKQRI